MTIGPLWGITTASEVVGNIALGVARGFSRGDSGTLPTTKNRPRWEARPREYRHLLTCSVLPRPSR